MATLPDASVDAVVCDPPYELGFMGKSWDASGIACDVEVWRQAFRVLKPGGHLLAFSGSRSYHRMTCAIEDAGFEIRDQIMWVYGSGFPKSLDVSKAIDKIDRSEASEARARTFTDAARQWFGWGTALKPAHEPICMARKPLIGTVAANVLAHGTGAINVDGCRIATDDPTSRTFKPSKYEGPSGYRTVRTQETTTGGSPLGRWPANFIHDGSDEAIAGLGEAARFFYLAKAGREDREEGCDGLEARRGAEAVGRVEGAAGTTHPRSGAGGGISTVRNHHPTVKPTELMRYLCRLVTPPGGTVLDPFTGSGSTGRGAVLEGFDFIGCELSPEYAEIARARIQGVAMPLFLVEVE